MTETALATAVTVTPVLLLCGYFTRLGKEGSWELGRGADKRVARRVVREIVAIAVSMLGLLVAIACLLTGTLGIVASLSAALATVLAWGFLLSEVIDSVLAALSRGRRGIEQAEKPADVAQQIRELTQQVVELRIMARGLTTRIPPIVDDLPDGEGQHESHGTAEP